MGLASEMVDTIKSSRFMIFTFLPDRVLVYGPAAVLQLVHGPAGRYRRARAGGGRGQRTVQSPSDALPGMGRRAGGTRPGCGVRASRARHGQEGQQV